MSLTHHFLVTSLVLSLVAGCSDYRFLEVTVMGDPTDPRPDDIGGDLTPDRGLHLVDVHLAMGDLVKLVKEQIAAHGN